MGRLKSFDDYVRVHLYERIFESLSGFVEDNPDNLDCRSDTIECPDEASLLDMEIQAIRIDSSGEHRHDHS